VRHTAETVLAGALDRVKRGWTKGALGRDADGNLVDAQSRCAVCWCLVGALIVTAPRANAARYAALRLIGQAIADFGGYSRFCDAMAFNDASATKRRDVLAVLRLALKEARAA
jgi:hypothetical protein